MSKIISNLIYNDAVTKIIGVKSPDDSVSGFVDQYPSVSSIPSGFNGVAQVGTQLYAGDGVTLNKIPLPARQKMLVIGNSIAGYSSLVTASTDNYYWPANGFIHWLRGFTLNGFDFVRTGVPTFPTVNGHTGALDRLGIYTCPGGDSIHILNDIAQIIDNCIETPTVVYVCNLVENDIGDSIATAVTLKNIDAVILQLKYKLPNATIIVGQPSPSVNFSTGVAIAAFITVKAYIANLSNRYSNVFTESNNATLYNTCLPILNLTSDNVIHPNERGALVRARAAFAELSWLFKPKNVVENETGNYVINPTLNISSTTGQNTGTNFLPQLPGWQMTRNTGWGDGTANQVITQNALGGIDLTIQRNGTVSTESVFSVFNTWQNNVAILANDLCSEFELSNEYIVNNPTNLFMIGNAGVAGWTSGNGFAGSYAVHNIQNSFYAAYPQGLSDLFQAGDHFIFTSPPIPLPSTGAKIYEQLGIHAVQAMPIAAASATTNPSVTIRKSNITKVNRLTKAVEVISATASPMTYTNQENYTHDMVVTGGTVSSIGFLRGGVTTATGMVTGIFTLDVGDSLIITYTVAPTISAIPRTKN